MLGLKLGKRRKQRPNIKMCFSSCRPTDRWPPSKQEPLNQRRVIAEPA